MKGVSVVVCCYNSEKRLPKTLAALSGQVINHSFPWEIIVVDNASTDRTAAIANTIWGGLESKTPFRVIKEPIAGLSNARKKGIQEANHDYIIFCDDDNWLQNDYVQLAFTLMEQHDQVGILGGRSKAEFEIEPPWWFDEYAKAYAVGQQYDFSGDVTGRHEKLWGAGCVYRKQALLFLYEHGFHHLLSDRIGNKIISGGDHELCLAIQLAGYRLYYDDRLRFSHFMPASRLTWNWYIRFLNSASYYSFLFDPYYKISKPGKGLKGYLKDTVWYSIYLSIRSLISIKPSVAQFISTPKPDSNTKHFSIFYEKYRLWGLFKNALSYRKMIYTVRDAAWLRNNND